jgi:hypothetical protein
MYKVLIGLEGEINKTKLFEMIRLIADLKKRVLEGLTTELQVSTFLAKCCMIKYS